MVQRQPDAGKRQVRVYKYGMVIKGELPQQAMDELYKSNALWNRLVEIHNENWKDIEKERCRASPEYQQSHDAQKQLTLQIDSLFDDKRTLRIGTGSMSGQAPENKEINQKIDELKKQRTVQWNAHKKLRTKADKLIDLKAMRDKRNDAFKEAVRVKNSGLGSQTADEVRRDFDNARDRILKNPGSGRLRFYRFDGTGYWNYRFRERGAKRDGVTWSFLMSGNEALKGPFKFVAQDYSRKKPRLSLRAKLAGGAKNDSRVFQFFDVIYHRPIPEEGTIQNGKILRTRIGDKFRYDLTLTVKLPLPQVPKTLSENAIGVDIGFRQTDQDETIRAFVMASVDGDYSKEIGLPVKMQRAFAHINERKEELDEAATSLGNIIKPLLKQMPEVDEWPQVGKQMQIPDDPQEKARYYVIKDCAAIAYAKSNVTLSFERAYKIARRILHHPNLLPEAVEQAILKWWRGYSRRYRELHNLRAKQLRHRNDYYRQVAAELVAQKAVIAVEKKFLAKIAETRDKDNELSKKARANRVLAAPHVMVSAIKMAAAREAIPFIEVNPWNTSKTCFECGAVNAALKSELEWRCQNCGASHDRDINAARNIAKKGQETYLKKEKKHAK